MKIPIKKIVMIILTFRGLIGMSTNITVSGDVSGQWAVDTVRVVGDISVPGENTLVIQPGTRVEFYGHFIFSVKGNVQAIGTATDSILFTVSDTAGFADTTTNHGGWHGFWYEHVASSNDTSRFAYCIFSYGKALDTDTAGLYGGAFRIWNWDKIILYRCTVESNFANRWGGGIFLKNSDIFVHSCTFRNNQCGRASLPYGYGGGLCAVSSSPAVLYCTFTSNSSSGVGGGASFEYSDPDVRFNVFSGNYSALGGGVGFLRSPSGLVVSNNFVDGNSAEFFGGGICCLRAHTILSNNTVVNNSSSYGGGFYANDSAVPITYNSVFWGNQGFGNSVYIWDVASAPGFINCDVEGGKEDFQGSGGQLGYHGIYLNNIDTVPLFAETGTFPYTPGPSSPLADAGTPDTSMLQIPPKDLAGNPRIYNGRIDIGCYERNPSPGIESFISEPCSLKASPNPFRTETYLSFSLDRAETGSATIYDQEGRVVKSFGPMQFTFGSNTILWNGFTDSGLRCSPGIYFCIIRGDRLQMITRIIAY